MSSQALRTLNDKQLDKKMVIPLTEDLKKLNKYVDIKLDEYCKMTNDNTFKSSLYWKNLSNNLHKINSF